MLMKAGVKFPRSRSMRSWVDAADKTWITSGSLYILSFDGMPDDVCDCFLLGQA